MIKRLFIKYREIILYLIIGVLTTVVYFLTRFTVRAVVNSPIISVIVAQITAIIFAFFTNKSIVFQNKTNNWKDFFVQFIKFCMARAFVFFLDIGITALCVDMYGEFFIKLFHLRNIDYTAAFFKMFSNFIGSPEVFNEFIFALLTQIIAIIANYLFSKLLIFKKQT